MIWENDDDAEPEANGRAEPQMRTDGVGTDGAEMPPLLSAIQAPESLGNTSTGDEERSAGGA